MVVVVVFFFPLAGEALERLVVFFFPFAAPFLAAVVFFAEADREVVVFLPRDVVVVVFFLEAEVVFFLPLDVDVAVVFLPRDVVVVFFLAALFGETDRDLVVLSKDLRYDFLFTLPCGVNL